MNLDDREARTLFHCVDYTLTQRALAGRTAPAAVVALRDRILNEIRDGATEETTGDLIGAREAARLLHCGERLVRTLAQELGGTRIAGIWVFSRAAVEEYARTPRRRQCPNLPRTD